MRPTTLFIPFAFLITTVLTLDVYQKVAEGGKVKRRTVEPSNWEMYSILKDTLEVGTILDKKRVKWISDFYANGTAKSLTFEIEDYDPEKEKNKKIRLLILCSGFGGIVFLLLSCCGCVAGIRHFATFCITNLTPNTKRKSTTSSGDPDDRNTHEFPTTNTIEIASPCPYPAPPPAYHPGNRDNFF